MVLNDTDLINELLETELAPTTESFEPATEEELAERLLQKSYSSDTTLHRCPREWQLYRLNTVSEEERDFNSSVTFAFGHAVGAGIADVLAGISLERTIFNMFLNWKPELDAEITKDRKSFYHAVFAIEKFHSLYTSNLLLTDYELVWLTNDEDGYGTPIKVPAVEVGYKILFPGGYIYRGHIDAILRQRETGKIMVLENKTTKNKVINPLTYQNSPQATGYSLILDLIFGELSSYDVLYLVYKSTDFEFEAFPFAKTRLQRAMWIQEQLLDIERIEMYKKHNYFPMHGENCVRFGSRDCAYANICHMSTELLVKNYSAGPAREDDREYMYTFDLREMLENQLEM